MVRIQKEISLGQLCRCTVYGTSLGSKDEERDCGVPLGFQDSEMQKLAWSFLSNPAASCTPPSQPLPRVSREDVQLSVLPVVSPKCLQDAAPSTCPFPIVSELDCL